MKVGFIGLGSMGLSMAHNIVKGGYAVAGFDANSEAVSRHVTNGGKTAAVDIRGQLVGPLTLQDRASL